MKRVSSVAWLLIVALFLTAAPVDARKKRRRRRRGKKKARKALVASKEATAAINKLLGKFKWGMSTSKVTGMVEQRIRNRFKPRIKAEKDAFKQDKIRREMREEIAKLKKSLVSFTGKRVAWDVSLVDKEFGHKNGEKMLVRWGQKARYFYFFHEDRLWKIYIAFNAEIHRGKKFSDFYSAMARRFGPATPVYTKNLKGEKVMVNLKWPQAGPTMLTAIDNTGFYGTFCLVLQSRALYKVVKDGREMNSPKKKYSSPLVEAALSAKSDGRDANENVIDQLTGRGVVAPKASDTYTPPSAGGNTKKFTTPAKGPAQSSPDEVAPAAKKKKKRKKIDPNDPLKDLDI